MARRPVEKLAGPTDARDLLRRELVYERVSLVRRLIFVATPHRGSRIVCGPVKDIGSRLVAPPERLRQARAALLASNGPDAFTPLFPGWISDEPRSARVGQSIAPGHRPVADRPRCQATFNYRRSRRLPGPGKGDGLVSYASAHHAGATSELIVNAGHVCLDNPEVIGEVARILKEHATP